MVAKSILQLCRELPASEPEIREREAGFDEAVRLATEPETTGRRYLRSIADAKAATDAIIASATGGAWWEFWLHNTAGGFHCELYHREGYSIYQRVSAIASTEELARSAACVLAAEAMKGGIGVPPARVTRFQPLQGIARFYKYRLPLLVALNGRVARENDHRKSFE